MILATANQMQEMDLRTIKEIGIPGRVLMEIAGREAAAILRHHYPQALTEGVAILTGRGNNGGDGMVMARWLAEAAIPVTLFSMVSLQKLTGDAAANAAIVEAMDVPIIILADQRAIREHRHTIAGHGVIVDALLGTGLNAPVTGTYAAVIEEINALACPILAVDIPSGLNADTGQPMGACVRATHTVTFGAAKIGHVLFPGSQYSGTVTVVDIGIPARLAAAIAITCRAITENEARRWLPERPSDAHKGMTGHVLVVGGSPGKIGAATMTAHAATRAGAGLVSLGVPAPLLDQAASLRPELMTEPLTATTESMMAADAADHILERLGSMQCLAIGPGLGKGSEIQALIARLARECPIPMVIDADGLNALCGQLAILTQRSAPTILTPHPGEMASLLETDTASIQADRIGAAHDLVARTGAHVVLKGAGTVIAHPDGTAWINTSGNAGMASGGMGDVLTGIIAGWIAQGVATKIAARLGVFLHGAAANNVAKSIGPTGYLATEVADALPRVLSEWQREAP